MLRIGLNIIRLLAIRLYSSYYRFRGINVGDKTIISYGAKLDLTYPKGISIGENTRITHGVIILSHDFSRKLYMNTTIGSNCFIGVNSVVLPGVTIGNGSIIGAGSVVTKDIPSNSVAVGNPAKVIKSNVKTTKFGQLILSSKEA